MNKRRAVVAMCVCAATVANGFLVPLVQAQERRERGGGDRRVQPRHASPHWVFDKRYNHRHYYPAIGYSMSVLPDTRIGVTFGGRHLFFNAGVWFAPARGGYVVVAPPIGAVVPVAPPAYVPVFVNGVTYYYANDTYYAQAPGGYAVVAPPSGDASLAAPPAPSSPPPSPQPAPQTSASQPVWYYCESATAYYPYVGQCPEGWKTVPAAPPSATP